MRGETAALCERNPDVAHAFHDAGHEIVAHGYRWIDHRTLDEETERDFMRRAVEGIERLTGERPVGWMTGRPSMRTRRLVVEEGGFLYDSDSYADDLPFWVTVDGKGHLVVPYSLVTNDGKLLNQTGTGEAWFGFVRDAFETLYREGERGQPKMLSVGLHMRLIGHPARAAGLERLLDHVAKRRGVWVAPRVEIARHWIATHPYPGRGLNEP